MKKFKICTTKETRKSHEKTRNQQKQAENVKKQRKNLVWMGRATARPPAGVQHCCTQ
jgi:hypothetical protein